MKSQPKVSVVIPTYNRSVLVQQAIDSVLAQTYRNYELIVVDDGSTDCTGELLTEKHGSNIRYIWQENQGESAARNRGLELAKGEYIAFLDSDDIWKPLKLERQTQLLDSAGEEVAFVFSSALVIDGYANARQPEVVGRLDRKERGLSDLIFSPFVFAAPSNILVRKTALADVGGFDTRVRYGEDWLVIVELVAKWRFSYIDEPLLYYRKHSGNQQICGDATKVRRIVRDGIYVLDRAARFIEDQNLIAKAKARRFEQAAMFCFLEGASGQGAGYLREAFDWDPARTTDLRGASKMVSGYLVDWISRQAGQDIESLGKLTHKKVLLICDVWFVDKSKARAFRNRILGLIYEDWLRSMQNTTLRTKMKFLARSYWYYPRSAVVRRIARAVLRRITFSMGGDACIP